MESLWLLKGSPDAAGWGPLEEDARAGKTDVLLFDRDAWALVRAEGAPEQYEGLVPSRPPAGLYLDNQGRPAYVAGGRLVSTPGEVLAGLGPEAQELFASLGDADLVLERLGRAY